MESKKEGGGGCVYLVIYYLPDAVYLMLGTGGGGCVCEIGAPGSIFLKQILLISFPPARDGGEERIIRDVMAQKRKR